MNKTFNLLAFIAIAGAGLRDFLFSAPMFICAKYRHRCLFWFLLLYHPNLLNFPQHKSQIRRHFCIVQHFYLHTVFGGEVIQQFATDEV